MILATFLLGGLTVVLPAEARVRGTELVLGSLAEVRGDDAALAGRVRALELGWTPAPGYSRVLQRWQVEQKLATLFPGAAITVEGSPTCRVAPETTRIGGDELRRKAESELRAIFGARAAELVPQGQVADVEIPLGEKPAELRCALERREQHAGPWSLPVQIWVDGTLYQTAWIGFTAELFEDVPVLVRELRRGEVVGAGDLELRRVRLSADLGGQPLSPAMLAGATLLRDLGAGSVLVERDVQRAKLVKSGDAVQLQVRKGAIVARGTALAKSDGAAGDRIRVLTQDKTRELTGLVIGRGLVEIDLGGNP